MAKKKDPKLPDNVINLEEARKEFKENMYLSNGKKIYESELIIGTNNGLTLGNPFGE